jgi:hypothetical protein
MVTLSAVLIEANGSPRNFENPTLSGQALEWSTAAQFGQPKQIFGGIEMGERGVEWGGRGVEWGGRGNGLRGNGLRGNGLRGNGLRGNGLRGNGLR